MVIIYYFVEKTAGNIAGYAFFWQTLFAHKTVLNMVTNSYVVLF